MKQNLIQDKGQHTGLESLKAKFTVHSPGSIREKVAAWAFKDATDVESVIRQLESIDCAACHSPAPVHYSQMAAEVAAHWADIDGALDSYRDATGEAWAPRKDQNFLCYLWFAYEWTARELADEIRNAFEDEGEYHEKQAD